MKKLLLGTLAILAPLGFSGSAHAGGVFGLFTNCHRDACCYPQQNAFTPSCCGVITIMSTAPNCSADGTIHNSIFGHNKITFEKDHAPSGWIHFPWGHKDGPASVRAAGNGYYGEGMEEEGYSAGGDESYGMNQGGYNMGDESYSMGENGTPMINDGYAAGQYNAPMGAGNSVNPSMLGLGAGETLVGDITIDGQVVSPGALGRMIQPQAPAFAPGANTFPAPAQQYVPAPAARPMMSPSSMNTPYRSAYPTIQQANYTPNQVPAQAGYYQPQNGYYQPQGGYYPYAAPQYGYAPYSQQQVPYYWNTLGGR